MSHELIRSWLDLGPDDWPPDHYRLLGLSPGADDISLIEQRVHQRLDQVRRYQMMHPEQATDAMNRLAQAFVCLTDVSTKARYDREVLGLVPCVAPPPLPVGLPDREGPEPEADPLAWLYASQTATAVAEPPPTPALVPPPVRLPPPLPPRVEAPPPPAPAPLPVAVPAEPVDAIREAARSPQACKGLCTRRGLYERALRTRRLQGLWRRLGRCLADPRRQLSKTEANELVRVLEEVEDELEEFPPPLGEAGQPGYMVLALMQMDNPRGTVLALSTSQRESLARDWRAGRKFLVAYRQCLLDHLRAFRRQGWASRQLFALRGLLNENPMYSLALIVALAGIAVAVWRTFWPLG